jgi:Fur family zinc uptake transcriptional regulator
MFMAHTPQTDCTFGCTHDHAVARDAAAVVARARIFCAGHRLKLTPSRAHVLESLAESAIPLGAYDLIECLAAKGYSRPAPPIIYRALEFLTANGFVHRIESKNAYLACDHIHHTAHDVIVFMLCEHCGLAQEASGDVLSAGLADVSKEAGFTPRAQVIELAGLCSACKLKTNPG